MKPVLLLSLAIACSLSTLPMAGQPAWAQGMPTVGLYTDASGTDMELIVQEPFGVMPIYVVVQNAAEVSAVQFAAPVPACFTNAFYIGEDVQFPLHIGDSQNGIAIAFGTCLSSPVHVLTINVYTTEPVTTMCYYPVLPSPMAASGMVETTDCDENFVYGIGLTSMVGTYGPPEVWAVNPIDGSTAAPLNSKLVWWIERHSLGLGVLWSNLYFGTDADPPLVASYLEDFMYDPGPLQPLTTYYWKVQAVDTDTGATMSDVWSFTTEGPVPAEPTSWGRIKSLFE